MTAASAFATASPSLPCRHRRPPPSQAVRKKYSTAKFLEVANIALARM